MNSRSHSSLVTVLVTAFAALASACADRTDSPAASSVSPYVGDANHGAILRFGAWVDLGSPRVPTDRKVSQAIEAQIRHLPGPLQFGAKTLVSPGRTFKVSNVRIIGPDGPGRPNYTAWYDYEGRVVVPDKSPGEIAVYLPLQPSRLFDAARAGLKPGELNPCADPHYQSKPDFWYFWSPARQGCNLVEFRDYIKVAGRIEAVPNTVETRPEYSRLVNPDGIIQGSLFFGLSHESKDANPYTLQDGAAISYRQFVAFLADKGFERVTPEPPTGPVPYLEETFAKDIPEPGRARRIRLRLFFGNTRYQSPRVKAFHQRLKPALENDSLIAYAGHSGLGRNMDLDHIREASGVRVRLRPGLYQIMLLESCGSYVYYNEKYFAAKATPSDPSGHADLELITNGLESRYGYQSQRLSMLVGAILGWAESPDNEPGTTYQDLIRSFHGNSLAGVLGDEDNGRDGSPGQGR